MTDTKYNGWTNYATWRINLEIFHGWDNEQLNSLTMGDNDNLFDQLKDYVESYLAETSEGLALNYALAFISDVNWYEIAEHLIESE